MSFLETLLFVTGLREWIDHDQAEVHRNICSGPGRPTILYFTLLYCTVLYWTSHYITVLYCTVQYSTVQYNTVLYSCVCGYILAWTTKRFPLPEVFPVCSFHQILTKLDSQNMSRYSWTRLDIVSVLWQEVKYSLSTREMPRAEPKRFSEGSGYISPYILSCVTPWQISKSYTSSIVLPGRAILEELILHINLAAGLYFPIMPSRWRNTSPYRPSGELCCGSTRKYTCWEEQPDRSANLFFF